MTENQDTCLLLFVKYPEKGKVKLRLSADLNEEIVQEIYRYFVQDTLTTVKKIDSQLFICFLPFDAQKKFMKWLGSTLLFLPQNGDGSWGTDEKQLYRCVYKRIPTSCSHR